LSEGVAHLKDATAQGVYFSLKDMIEFARDGIVSKTVLKATDKEVSLFCMAAGQSLSSHTSSFPAIIHVLRGKGEVTLANKRYEAKPNAWFLHASQPATCNTSNRRPSLLTHPL